MAQSPASVAGTVHDANGNAQIGALVQLLAPDSSVIASAFTDSNGHYDLRSASSGVFAVRATASMFLPVVRQNVALNVGAHTALDLTLTSLTEVMEWLPAKPRGPQDSDDDWKWTLRSPANRPILRDFDPTIILASSTDPHEHATLHELRARASVISRTAEFANSGVHQIITFDRAVIQKHDYFFRADIAPSGGQSASALGSTSFELAPGQTIHMAANYQWHSDLVNGPTSSSGPNGGTQMGSANLRIAQTSELGPNLQVEAGNELEQVGWGDRVTQTHPFLVLTDTPNENVTISYALSTSPGFSKADDADETIERTPLAAPSVHGLTLEHGLHQQFSWTHDFGPSQLSAAVFHDIVDDPVLQGTASLNAIQSSGLPAGLDSNSGVFREAGQSYSTSGIEVSAAHQFGPIQAALALMDANALNFSGFPPHGTSLARAGNAQLASLALRGVVTQTHTYWKADYGEQSHNVLVPLSAFDLDGPAPFLNMAIRQPIHGSNFDAIVQVRNLLAQGYHPFLAPDGQTIFFLQVPRSLQGGLVFSF